MTPTASCDDKTALRIDAAAQLDQVGRRECRKQSGFDRFPIQISVFT
jgi:hypothetical protein